MNRLYSFPEMPDLTGENFELRLNNCTTRKTVSDNYYEFCFFSSGRASFAIGSRKYNVAANTVILIPPEISHTITSTDSSSACRDITLRITP